MVLIKHRQTANNFLTSKAATEGASRCWERRALIGTRDDVVESASINLDWGKLSGNKDFHSDSMQLHLPNPSKAQHVLAMEQSKEPVQISLHSFFDGRDRGVIRIKVADNSTPTHGPATIVLVIDESGSMGDPAVHHDDTEGKSGLTQLDVVKHAARTIIETLSNQDRLAVIAFSSQARIVLPLTRMTQGNKTMASRKINKLQPKTTTNLYDGIHTALEIIRKTSPTPQDNANVLVLTDGMPNVSPPRGELATLQRYLNANQSLSSVRISTFGFGYSLKSRLLSMIAQKGRSTYSFIPDSSFVGTVFINAMANLLSTAVTQEIVLTLEPNLNTVLQGCLSGHCCSKSKTGLKITVPSLLYGQEVDVVVSLSAKPQSEDPFHASLAISGRRIEAHTKLVEPFNKEYPIIRSALIRSELIQFIVNAEGNTELCNKSDEDFVRARRLLLKTKLKVLEIIDGDISPDIIDLCKDLDGQITQAYAKVHYYRRWGSHYLLSLAGAHAMQHCTNFKDPGLQEYATEKCKAVRDRLEDVFLKIPPPKPSRTVTIPIKCMRAFYNQSALCFARGFVTLENGTKVDVSQVRPGDMVQSSETLFARVVCVVVTPCKEGAANLVSLDGGRVLVTPWHPVRPAEQGGSWTFPCHIQAPQRRPCQAVYSFVLEDGAHSLRIGSYDGISLGHGLRGNPVVEHEFFGTNQVLRSLSLPPSWSSSNRGRIVYLNRHNPVVRDPENGKIIDVCVEQIIDTTEENESLSRQSGGCRSSLLAVVA